MRIKPSKELILQRFVVGPLEVNAYVVADPDSKEAFLIDPGADPEEIKRFISGNGLDLKFVINTHGHGDHIGANGAFGVPVYIHGLDAGFLQDASLNLSLAFGFPIISPEASRLLVDHDRFRLGGLEILIIHTPGHTRGSISIKVGGAVFTGDALFNHSIGRTDLPGSSEEALLNSIRNRLLTLPDDTDVYPGHGEPTTVGQEKRSNPFLV